MRKNIHVQITLVKRVDQDGLVIGIWICDDGNKMPVSTGKEKV